MPTPIATEMKRKPKSVPRAAARPVRMAAGLRSLVHLAEAPHEPDGDHVHHQRQQEQGRATAKIVLYSIEPVGDVALRQSLR